MKNKSVDRKHAQTQRPAGSDMEKKNTPRKSLTQTAIADMSMDEFESRIMDVDIKKPRSAYNFYIADMKEKHGSGNQTITDISKEFGKKWSKLSSKEKEKYEKMADEDKTRYNEHTALVKKFILSKPLKESANALTIYIDEHVSEAIENNEDPKEARKRAMEKWKEMSADEKQVYEEKRDKHRQFYEELKKSESGTVSGYTLYCQDAMLKAREKGETMTLKDCAANWKNLKQSTKDKYDAYAEEVREEREKNRNLYEVAFGIKPKRPRGPYNFYLMDLAKQGKFTGFKGASKSWSNLPEDQKEKYQRTAKKAALAYMIKKAEYKSTVRKAYSKPKSAFNLFVSDMSGKNTDMKDDDTFFNYCYNKWKKADENLKKKYQKKADELAAEHAERREELDSRVFDMPKRPSSGYNLYIADRIPVLKEKHPGKATTELFKAISEEWKDLKKSQKEKYNEAYLKQLDAYKEQVKEFRTNGFYTPGKADMGKRSTSKKSNSKRSVSKSTKKGKGK
jgi:hypothetical protein